jgi:hypothetical protein
MDKEINEVPIELYATRNGEFIKYVKYEDYIDLQQRIYKAVEYIEMVQKTENDINPYVLHAPTLLKILKGDDTKGGE